MIPFVIQVNVVVDYIRAANDDFPERIHCSVNREGMLVLLFFLLCTFVLDRYSKCLVLF